MTISTTYAAATGTSTQAKTQAETKTGLSSLDQGDFLRLMTVQMQNQDPFDPVDQKEMLAQMAQFSSLAGITEVNQTLGGLAEINANLKDIAAKLDAALGARPATEAAVSQDAAATTTGDTAGPENPGDAVLPQE